MTVKMPARCASRRRLVDHAVLQPQRRQLQPDAVIHDPRNMLRPPEDIDDIHLLARRQRPAAGDPDRARQRSPSMESTVGVTGMMR